MTPTPVETSGPIVSRPRVHWLGTLLVGVVVAAFAGAAAYLFLAGASRILPAAEVPATLVDTNSYMSRSANNGIPTRVYEVIGVTADGNAFTVTSRDLYDAFITEMPVEGTADVARITSDVVRFEARGVSGGGGTGTGIFQLIVGVVVLAMAVFVTFGITRPSPDAPRRVSAPAIYASLAIGAALGLWISLAVLPEDQASARQLAASTGDVRLPQDGQIDIGDIDVDVDISLPPLDLDLDLDTDVGLDRSTTPLPPDGGVLGSFRVTIDEVQVIDGGVVANARVTNESAEEQFEFVSASLVVDGEEIESDFRCTTGDTSGFGLGGFAPGETRQGLICRTPTNDTDLSGAELHITSIEAFGTTFTLPLP